MFFLFITRELGLIPVGDFLHVFSPFSFSSFLFLLDFPSLVLGGRGAEAMGQASVLSRVIMPRQMLAIQISTFQKK